MLSKQILVFAIFLSLCVFSCKKVDINFGQQLIDNDYTQIIKIDTFTADLSTVYVDSFVTSAKGVTMLGGYNDTAFGRIDTKCFFEVAPPTYQAIYDSTKLDSLYLILKLNKSYYGDTTQPLHIDVNQLSEPIVFPENVYSFYNNRQFAVYPTPIGFTNVIVQPTNYTDSITIRLSDALGSTLLKKLQNRADLDMQSTFSFLQYFNGLRLSSNANSKMILNCTDQVVMRLSYNKPGIDSAGKYHTDFTLANNQHHFNNIMVDRSKSVLKNIGPNNKIIPSSQLGNRAFSQYAAGVMAKVTFPSLKELLKVPNYAKILTAQLKVVPVRNSFDTRFYLPPSVMVSTTDINNGIGNPLSTYSSSGALVAQEGNLYIDQTLGDNTAYTYDMSNFVKALIKTNFDNTTIGVTGLLLVPPLPALQTQFSRLIIGSKYHPVSKTILEIYYVTVK
ncbi:DUF4270 family protein [Parasediminibacterium sp. JCM 36343]|uniref:DUF4270 family protein n=1 Tax=Parasediminibacterium sp. JCM 36343 TaxID=3374279 RepID=UPI00397D3740